MASASPDAIAPYAEDTINEEPGSAVKEILSETANINVYLEEIARLRRDLQGAEKLAEHRLRVIFDLQDAAVRMEERMANPTHNKDALHAEELKENSVPSAGATPEQVKVVQTGSKVVLSPASRPPLQPMLNNQPSPLGQKKMLTLRKIEPCPQSNDHATPACEGKTGPRPTSSIPRDGGQVIRAGSAARAIKACSKPRESKLSSTKSVKDSTSAPHSKKERSVHAAHVDPMGDVSVKPPSAFRAKGLRVPGKLEEKEANRPRTLERSMSKKKKLVSENQKRGDSNQNTFVHLGTQTPRTGTPTKLGEGSDKTGTAVPRRCRTASASDRKKRMPSLLTSPSQNIKLAPSQDSYDASVRAPPKCADVAPEVEVNERSYRLSSLQERYESAKVSLALLRGLVIRCDGSLYSLLSRYSSSANRPEKLFFAALSTVKGIIIHAHADFRHKIRDGALWLFSSDEIHLMEEVKLPGIATALRELMAAHDWTRRSNRSLFSGGTEGVAAGNGQLVYSTALESAFFEFYVNLHVFLTLAQSNSVIKQIN